MRHGAGVFTTTAGRRYDGSWAASVRHGPGKEVWPNGERVSVPCFHLASVRITVSLLLLPCMLVCVFACLCVCVFARDIIALFVYSERVCVVFTSLSSTRACTRTTSSTAWGRTPRGGGYMKASSQPGSSTAGAACPGCPQVPSLASSVCVYESHLPFDICTCTRVYALFVIRVRVCVCCIQAP